MRRLLTLLTAATVLALAACAVPADSQAPTIALLLPESKTSRYEGIDRPVFEEVVAERCAECRVLYANAGQDAARQQQQAESALTQGAQVLVLGAVDASAAQSIVTAAAERGVAVIAYDRFIADAPLDFFVAYDPVRVGQLQGQALVAAVGPTEPGEGILVVQGASTDPNVAGLRTGLASALEGSGLTVLAEHETPDWSPDKAQEWVQGQLTQFAGRVVGVYAANDGTAGGAISAMRAAGLDPVPPVTGQDAELAAIQRIVAGDQYMTVYKAISQQARTAAELSVRILRGEVPAATVEVQGIPSVLLAPVAVTRERVAEVIVGGGVHSAAEICVEPYTAACRELGLVGTEDQG
ncbi:substrate-binding domain-containing protein [Actinotalea sp.]|uniref:sugar ABC transporter substrate-binding protein n=1 Tax=Actinotalea sp. TaxID=1872145 RepID=UPI002C52F18F|nr:substrate-binding domain-containing protein [Actinotalea sp.]HQY34425.1 substrate-binding domain-containing protein [Actinotalea sp.]HRA49464.1 substrate-binding domain-containing protein [Actinotalea sp.]